MCRVGKVVVICLYLVCLATSICARKLGPDTSSKGCICPAEVVPVCCNGKDYHHPCIAKCDTGIHDMEVLNKMLSPGPCSSTQRSAPAAAAVEDTTAKAGGQRPAIALSSVANVATQPLSCNTIKQLAGGGCSRMLDCLQANPAAGTAPAWLATFSMQCELCVAASATCDPTGAPLLSTCKETFGDPAAWSSQLQQCARQVLGGVGSSASSASSSSSSSSSSRRVGVVFAEAAASKAAGRTAGSMDAPGW